MKSPERRTRPASKRQFSEYYAPRPAQAPPQITRHRARLAISKKAVIVGVLMAIVLIAIPFMQLNPAKADIRLSSVTYRPKTVYDQAVKAELSRMLYRSFFTLDERSISDNLRKKFPEISQVSIIAKPFSRAVNVKITTKVPSFIIVSSTGSFIVDSSGLAVTKVESQNQTTGLVRLEDSTGFQVNADQQVFSSQDMQFIAQLIEGLRINGTSIARLELPPIAKQLRLYQGGVNYYIKFHTAGDAKLQLGSFLAVSKQLTSEGKQPTEYIDVRVEGKVFYK